MNGLAPSSRYCYRVEFGTTAPVIDLLGADPSISFATQLPAGAPAPFSFAVLGDFGAAGTTQAGVDNRQADVMAQIANSDVRFAVGTGDTAYPSGTQTNYGDLRQTGSDVSSIFAPQFWANVGDSIPFFNAAGNHGFSSTFLSMWPQANAAQASGGRYAMDTYCCPNGTNSASYPSAWYAFDAGVARFYVLDAAWSSSTSGRATSTRTTTTCTGHPAAPSTSGLRTTWLAIPRSSSSPSSTTRCIPPTRPSHPIRGCAGPTASRACSRGNGVAIGFSGHAHNYTRNEKPDGGLVTYVTGGGGARLQPATKCSAPVAYAIGWSYTTGG